MNKTELIAQAAKEANMTQHNLRCSLDALAKTIIQALESGENVSIKGLGTFTVKTRKTGKRVLPANGKGPVKGVSGERAIFIIKKRKMVKFNITPLFNKEFPEEKESVEDSL